MKRLLLCVVGLLAFQLWAGTRTVAHFLHSGEAALFAVPDGCSFASATASSAAGASVAVTVGEPTTMNSVTLVSVTVAADATVTVVFADGAPTFAGRPSKVLRQRIRAQVVNPEDVPLADVPATPSSRGASRLKLATVSTPSVDVLVLSPHDHVALWEKYQTARAAAHPELTFAVRDLDEVYTVHPLGSTGVRNYAESIHAFLRDYVPEHGVSYVILGGSWMDAQFVSANGEWLRDGNVVKTLEGKAMTIKNAVPGIIAYPRNPTEAIPSDMFYACLDLKEGQTYPWIKGEATRYYETFMNEADRKEYDSGVDVVVSRIPLKPIQFAIPEGAQILDAYKSTMHVGEEHLFTPAELMDYFIAKLERAEAPGFAGQGRLGFSWGDFNYTKRDLDASLKTENEFFDDIPNFFAKDRQTDQYGNLEMRHRDRFKDIVAPNYPVQTVDARCEHGTTWTKGLPSVQAAQDQFLKTDHDFNVVAMHGWAGGSAHYHVEDAYRQTGLILFNDMSFPCETGWPDFVDGKTYVVKPCCGEATVTVPFGGSIASVNNTRSGWAGGVGQLSDQHNVNGYKGFLQRGDNAGETWLAAHLDFAGIKPDAEGFQASNTGGTGAWVLSEHILYGDPLVRTQALVDYAEPQSAFPKVAKNVALAAEVTVAGSNAVVNATAAGDVAFTADPTAPSEWESAHRGGLNRMKILNTLTVGGSAVSVGAGLEGGINRIVFADAAPEAGGGTVTLDTTERFYVGGVANAQTIRIRGTGAIIDCDNLSNVGEIVFEMAAGATNILRGIKTGALAGIPIRATGGTILCESSNLFGGTTVALEGTTVALGSDPSVGKLVASGEPFNATFTGSGRIEYTHGTELLKQWTIAGNIQLVEVGTLTVGFAYSGAVGANPTGWFTSWRGEGFSDANGVLAPDGKFVRSVAEGQHPHYPLPSKKGFTLALYADLAKVTNAKAVMLSLGSSGNFNQLLLLKDGEKVRLEVAGTLGGAAAADAQAEVAYPGAGYHLYVIEKTEEDVKLYVDSFLPRATIAKAFPMTVGFQVGSQYGGLKAGRTKALGMAVAAIRGYDAILTQDELSALTKEFAAKTLPLAMDEYVELNKSETNGRLVDANFGKTAYLGGSNGILTIPEGTTVNAYGVKFNNTSRSADDVTMDVYGTLNILGTTTSAGVYADLRNATQIAGIMLGHYAGTSALNVYGLVDAPKADLLIGYTCAGTLTIDGGTVRLHGLTNQAGGIRNDKGRVVIKNNGVLELAAWPVRNVAQPGTMPIEIADGTIRATADWTCPWDLTVLDTATIDANGHNVVFAGAFLGNGDVRLVDSKETGSITVLGDLSAYEGSIRVGSTVKTFGTSAGNESRFSFDGRPATMKIQLTDELLESGYTSTAWSEMGVAGEGGVKAATLVFVDRSGNVLQEGTGTAANVYVKTTWTEAMPYHAHDRDWSYVFIPQKGNASWENLPNWRKRMVSDLGVSKWDQMFAAGMIPPHLHNASNLWGPALLDAALFPDGSPEEGFVEVRAAEIEGWTPKFGVYNGVHLIIDQIRKFQGPTGDKWFVVDDKSRITINSFGTDTYANAMILDVANEEGLVFNADIPSSKSVDFQYNFVGNGSVKWAAGITRCNHAITGAEMTLSEKSNRFKTSYKKIVDFGEHAGAPTFTVANTASIRIYNADGSEDVVPTNVGTPMNVLTPTSEADIGKYALMQDKHGLYLCYVDYDSVETVITIKGPQTKLDLNQLKDDFTEKFVITGASGYFKNDNPTIELPVEFRDSAEGHPAWTWNNGYSSNLINFKHATGPGTIAATGASTSMMIVMDYDSTFNGSIDFSNSKNRLVFGDVRSSVASAQTSSITVDQFHPARIKRNGVWKADTITINGMLAIDGRATIEANRLTINGAINAEASVGSVFYENFADAVSDAAGREAIKLYRSIEGHRLNQGETIRILPNNQTFSVKSFFPVTTTREGEVYVYTAQIVSADEAVASIDGIYYDTWQHALDAQRENGFSILVVKADNLPGGYMVVDGKLVKAQAQVGETLYPTFAQALAENEPGTVITLLEDTAHELVFTKREDVLRLQLNGHRFLRPPTVVDAYVFALVESVDQATGVTTYAVREVEHEHNAFIDRVIDGETVRYWYSTFEEAVGFAGEDETIHLNADLILNSSVELLPSTTVDFGGHTLTAAEEGVTIADDYHTVTVSPAGAISIAYTTYVWNGTGWEKGGHPAEAPGRSERAVIPSAFGDLDWTTSLEVETLTVRCNSLTLRNATLKAAEIDGTGTIILDANAVLAGPSAVAVDVKMTAATAALEGALNFGGRTLELAAGEIRGKIRADVRKVGPGTLVVSAVQRGDTEGAVYYDVVGGTLDLAVDPGVYLSYKGSGATIRLRTAADISGYIINSTSAIIVETLADTVFEYNFEDWDANNTRHEFVKLGPAKLTMNEKPWESVDKVDIKEGLFELKTKWVLKTGQRFNVYPGTHILGTGSVLLGRNDAIASPAELHMLPGGIGKIAQIDAKVAAEEAALNLSGNVTVKVGFGYIGVAEGLTLRLGYQYTKDEYADYFDYRYKGLIKIGKGTLELLPNFNFQAQLKVYDGLIKKYYGATLLGNMTVAQTGEYYEALRTDAPAGLQVNFASVPHATKYITYKGMTFDTSEFLVDWESSVVVEYTADPGFDFDGEPTKTIVIPRVLEGMTIGGDLKVTDRLSDATYSLDMNGNCWTMCALLGGTALPRTGDNFNAYQPVRGEKGNQGATAGGSNNGPYCHNSMIADTSAWSVLTVASLSSVEKGVLWALGRVNSDASGLALIQQNAGRSIALVQWVKANANPTVIVSYSVDDGRLTKQLHSYLVTYDNQAYVLYVDGVRVASKIGLFTYSMTGYQLGGVHGGSATAHLAVSAGAVIDAFGVWSGQALGAKSATELAAKFPVWSFGPTSWAEVTAETEFGQVVPSAQAEALSAMGATPLKLAAWATANGISFNPQASVSLEAYVLNCAPAAVEAERAAFKVTIEMQADGTAKVSLPDDKLYNVEPVIQGRESLGTGDWFNLDEENERAPLFRFFRAILP